MRGLVLLVLGFVLGVGLMLLLWPRIPAGQALPQTGDVRVSIADGYLTRLANQRLAGIDVPRIRNVRVASQPPTLLARADIGIGPLSTAGSLQLLPRAQGGQVRVQVVNADVAGIPVPPQFTVALQSSIDSAVRSAVGPHLWATGVAVTSRGLVVTASYR